MKLKTLYGKVNLLAFGRGHNRVPEEDFIAALNMAAESVNAVRPLTGRREYPLSDGERTADGYLFDASEYADEVAEVSAAALVGDSVYNAQFCDGKVLVIVPPDAAEGACPRDGNCAADGKTLTLKYYRLPHTVTEEAYNANEELDLSPDGAYLVPYLTASILLGEEQPELAAVYLDFYESHINDMPYRRIKGSTVSPWLGRDGESIR